MKKQWLVVVSFLALVFSPGIYAGAGEQDWKSMTPEERREAKDAKRAEWESLSDEDKQARKEQRRSRFESLSDADKQARNEQRRARFDALSDEEKQKILDSVVDTIQKKYGEDALRRGR